MNTATTTPAPTNVCPRCGAEFRCGMEAGDQECWCASLPALLPLPAPAGADAPAASCLCLSCLRESLAVARDIRART